MIEYMVKEEVILYVMGVLVFVGVLLKMVASAAVRGIVRGASDIQKSNHRLMKLLKAKFEHASMVSDRVQNVEAFVDKYLFEHRILWIRIHTFIKLPRKCLLIVAVLGTFGIFESYRISGAGKLMSEYLQWTSIFVLFLVLVCFLGEEGAKLKAAKNYAVEYLENVCVNRYMKRQQEEAVQPVAEEVQEPVQPEVQKSGQEVRIRAILEEFLA